MQNERRATLDHPAPPGALAQQIRELVATNTGAGVLALPGAPELVTALTGTRPLAITSNSPAEITRDYLQATGIPDTFDTIVGVSPVGRYPAPAHPSHSVKMSRNILALCS
ncbi:MAG: hypothetical protein ACRDQ4_27570 [Pseudonocardiaceae bacterium]